MRKGFAIVFVLVLILRGFDAVVEGLAMLPSLMDHFHAHHHHSQDSHEEELSFLDFLMEHYGNRSHHDDDEGDHANLPFSHAGKSCADFEIAPLKSIPIHGAYRDDSANSKAALALNTFYSRLYRRDIFRPPLV
ncbi:MAG: hypothetical protein IPH04_05720 [Saprospirales bacterium]|jgi:hypothetical protein|nr:hypothetical protein [Saprospirales bacterium]MBK6902313.1 hypothetical protein [Saprospirales bacterium]MBK7335001.1 hypothetical protein [Saprospirales bacterium]